MKIPMNKYLIAVMMAVAAILPVSAEDLFPGLEDVPGVESVYVSKSMMMNYAKSRDILWRELNIYDIESIEEMSVYSGRTPEAIAAIEKDMKEFVTRQKKLTTLVKSKSDKDVSVIYGVPLEGEKEGFSMLIIFNKGKDCSLVVLKLKGDVVFQYGAFGNLMLPDLRDGDGFDFLRQ